MSKPARQSTQLQPWEQQPDESPQAYRAFKHWLETDPPAARNVVETYRQIYNKPNANQAGGSINIWVVKYRWQDRALAYDQHQARVEHAARLAVIAANARKWAERRERIAERDYEQAEALRAKVDQIAALPVVRQTLTNETTSPDGRMVIQHYTIEPLSVRAADAATILKLLSERQRLAADMATQIVETTDPQSKDRERLDKALAILADSYNAFPDQEYDERIAQIADACGVPVESLRAVPMAGAGMTMSEMVS